MKKRFLFCFIKYDSRKREHSSNYFASNFKKVTNAVFCSCKRKIAFFRKGLYKILFIWYILTPVSNIFFFFFEENFSLNITINWTLWCKRTKRTIILKQICSYARYIGHCNWNRFEVYLFSLFTIYVPQTFKMSIL